MATVGELVAILRADAKQFTATMEGAQAEVGALEAETTTAGAAMNKAMLGIGAASIAGIALSVKAFQGWADQVRTVQRVSGLSAEQASKLTYAFARVGIDATTAATAVGLLGKNITNQSSNFEKYGLAVTKANGQQMGLIQIIGEAADKYVALGGGLQGAAFAMNIFGRGGKALIPILKGGSDGLRAYMQEAKQLGLVMSQDDLDASLQLTIAGRHLEETFKGLGVTLGREFVPVVTEVVDGVQHAVEWFDKLNPDVAGNVLKLGLLVGGIAAVNKVLGFLVGGMQSAVRFMRLLTGTTTGAATSMKTLEVAEGDAVIAGKLFVANAQGIVVAEREVEASSGQAGAAMEGAGAAGVTAGSGIKAVGAAAFASRGQIALIAAASYSAYKGFQSLLTSSGDIANQFQITTSEADKLQGAIMSISPSNELHRFADPFGVSSDKVKEASAAFQQFASDAMAAGRGQTSVDSALDAALPKLNANRASISDFSAALYASAGLQKDASGAITDTTAALSDLLMQSKQFPEIQKMTGSVSAGLQQLADVSGQSMSSIQSSWDALLINTKATSADYMAEIDQIRAAEDAFTSSTIQAFGGSSGAISQFFGKTHVDFSKLMGDLSNYKDQLKVWMGAFSEIQRNGGKDASQFLSDMRAQGLGSIGILQAVAGQTKDNQKKFLAMYNSGNDATSNLADVITHTLVPKFDIMIARLTAIALKLGALPAPKIDNSQALTSLKAIQTAAQVTAEKVAGIGGPAIGSHGGGGGAGGTRTGNPSSPDTMPHRPGQGGSHSMGGVIAAIARHFAMGGDAHRYAGGGGVDTVPAMLQPGEYVMRKAAVDKYGAGFFDTLNRSLGAAASGAVHGSLGSGDLWRRQAEDAATSIVALTNRSGSTAREGMGIVRRVSQMGSDAAYIKSVAAGVGKELNVAQAHHFTRALQLLDKRTMDSGMRSDAAIQAALGKMNHLLDNTAAGSASAPASPALWRTQAFAKNVPYLPPMHTNLHEAPRHHHRGPSLRVILDRRHMDEQETYQEDYGRGY